MRSRTFTIVSPRTLARIAGAFYLGTIVLSVFSEFARESVIVSANAVATGQHILASEALYRWAFTANLVASACYVVVTALLYELLKPVSKSLSLVAAFLSLVGIAVGSLSGLGRIAPLLLLGGARYLTAFNPAQLQAMAYASLKLEAQGTLISLVFFGFYCCLVGYLIFKSTFFPKTVGILLAIAGLSYLLNTFANFVSPVLATQLSSFVLLPALVGEGALTLWLLLVGVNVAKWEEKVNTE